MIEFLAGLYEWWGLSPLYATDMGDHLRGYNISCSYDGTPWYSIVASIMVVVSFLTYSAYYHVIDKSTWQRREHWVIFLAINFIINFFIAYAIPMNDLSTENYCSELTLSIGDCIGFGVSNGIWAIILFSLVSLSPFPRKLSVNCRNTPWKQ
ncbi:hypothetical protein [uncultured Pontibacter sp.]|uniref:hypothetical protein n=1 Tax=uncultured Pontibacter sp. TaxID=453356 RepID=UPI002634F1F8|nr:hypothetical protein [uncultured Pontibacter sp.]